jgi:hypothetical protein
MAYKVTETIITPKDSMVEFDAWFDPLPLGYFSNNPDTLGKNKFEVLEMMLIGKHKRVIDGTFEVEVPQPLTDERIDTIIGPDIHNIHTTTWSSKRDYQLNRVLKDKLFDSQEHVDFIKNNLDAYCQADLEFELTYPSYWFQTDQTGKIIAPNEMLSIIQKHLGGNAFNGNIDVWLLDVWPEGDNTLRKINCDIFEASNSRKSITFEEI